MEGPWIVIVFVVIVAGVIALAWLSYQQQKKRREALAALAAKLGWEFDPDHDRSHDEQYAQFGIFCRGHSRAAYNTLSGGLKIGDAAWPAKMGDFTYKITRYTGKTVVTTTYRFSYLIVHLPSAATPGLLIRPENVLDKIAGAMGFDDIDFESAEFSRRFHVKSPDKRFAYDVIHPKMMEFLLRGKRPSVHIEGGCYCQSEGASTWVPEGFLAGLEWTREFFELWPRHLAGTLA